MDFFSSYWSSPAWRASALKKHICGVTIWVETCAHVHVVRCIAGFLVWVFSCSRWLWSHGFAFWWLFSGSPLWYLPVCWFDGASCCPKHTGTCHFWRYLLLATGAIFSSTASCCPSWSEFCLPAAGTPLRPTLTCAEWLPCLQLIRSNPPNSSFFH